VARWPGKFNIIYYSLANNRKAAMQKYLDTAVQAARRAAELIRENRGKLSASDIDSKQAFDFVTRVDKEAERVILDILQSRFPDHSFLAEESRHDSATDGYRWIIDPLDGTTNYIHGFPVTAVSIALQHGPEMVAGVVFDLFRDELFTAIKGEGAFLNGQKIHVSATDKIGSALIGTGFPFKQKHLIDHYLRLFKKVLIEVSDLRRPGSASIDLSYIACGRFDGFFEIGLMPWDCAAGALMIKEAGGVITNFGGGDDILTHGNIVAGNPQMHARLLKMTREVFAGVLDE
jgi:myo-inositol-1(or 4)-monophosphatase